MDNNELNRENEIVVSVICKTYNHEKYIRDALEGFVNQKTNFRFEVIIHDDASTDKTADIIREYESKYPSIIKPIYQTENQYSKGVSIVKEFILPVVRGVYIALCEGDDYWIDEYKLQTQVDFMENNPGFSACVHNTEFYIVSSNRRIVKYDAFDKNLELMDCVLCGGQSFHTSSVLVKKNIYFYRPDFTKMIKGVGDYPLAIYYSLSGRIHYIGKVMSVYRHGTEGSWSKRVGANRKRMISILQSSIMMLQSADEYSKYEFHQIFEEGISRQQYQLIIANQKYKIAIKNKWFKNESILNKIKYRILAYMPFLTKIKNHFQENYR